MTRRRIPTRERVALFERAGGRCYLCGEKIDGTRERWEIEHVIALELGGTEAPMDENLQPAHAACHKRKTSTDAGLIAKAKRREAKHTGAHRSRSPLRNQNWKRKIDGTVERREP